MSDLRMKLGLVDNISPALSKAEKQTIANLNAFKNLEKETLDLERALDKLKDQGLQNSEMYRNLDNIIEKNTDTMGGLVAGTEKASMATESAGAAASGAGMAMIALNQTLDLVQKGWDLVTKAVQQAYEWMEKYNTQFNAEFTAGVKMHNILGATNDEIQSMYDYAAALQKVGVIGDEVTISAMAELSTYTRTTDQLKKLIPQVLNMAVADKGLAVSEGDVTSAAGMLGRALNGQARMLRRQLGLTQSEVDAIDALNDRTAKADKLVELLSQRFGNANEILAQTAGGGLLQTRNAMGDLQEMIGEKLAPYIAQFERAFYQIIQPAVEWIIDNLDTLLPVLLGTAAVLGVIVATIAIINFGPIIALVGIIGLVIYAILEWSKKQDELTGQTHDSLGLITGMLTAFVAFFYNVIIVPIYNTIAAVANFVGNVFNDPIASVKILFIDLGKTILNIASTIAGVLDTLFGSSIQSTINGWISNLDTVRKEVVASSSYEDVMKPLENWDVTEAAKAGYNFGAEISSNISKAIDDSNFFGKFGDAIGIGEDGDVALKTTSADKLLGEEDIQLLLDVATRDFKVDYQQITPQIEMNFGDINQPMDIDYVMEEFSTRMQEAIESDLEVAAV